MASPSFASLDGAGLKVTAALDGAVLRVAIAGSVESREPGAQLDPYWSELDAALRRDGITQVELDLFALDFMNSSGILTLVRWVMKAKAAPAYVIVVHYDPNLTWQKSNVPVLAKLAPTVVRLATP